MPTDRAGTDVLPADVRAHLLAEWERALPNQLPMGEDLLARYCEPHRHYHNATHLASVLRHVEELAGDHDLFLVRLAAWFHDAVYAVPPGQLTNEEASARLAFRELSRAGLEQEDLNEVARLVRVTATHTPGARDPEGELLCDADLAILASPSAEYQAYAEAIRAEYAAIPEEQFIAGRLEIMGALAETDIFRTGKARALVAPAKANVEAECARLAARLDELQPNRVSD
ncbi:MAG TPA: HD domain-containing protein [Propionibacteriaceae bacterium]|nr:HD domain-containing protein [Propionibacteriaceae bacterium]